MKTRTSVRVFLRPDSRTTHAEVDTSGSPCNPSPWRHVNWACPTGAHISGASRLASCGRQTQDSEIQEDLGATVARATLGIVGAIGLLVGSEWLGRAKTRRDDLLGGDPK